MMTRNTLHRPLGETENMLEQWGYWRMDGMGVPSYASPTLALMRDAMPMPGKSYVITDELAGLVDAAVAGLCARHQQMGDMVWFYYGAKWPAIRVGRHFAMSEGKARGLIKAGAAWVDCYLESVRSAA